MAYAILLIALALFLGAINRTQLVGKVKAVIAVTSNALEIMRSHDLDEAQKEAAIQKAAIGTLGAFFSITLRALVACAVPGVFVYLLVYMGVLSPPALYDALTNWYFIVATSVLMIGAFYIGR